MTTRRAPNGRFLPKNAEACASEEVSKEGFLTDFKSFLKLSYKIWRFIPLLILLLIIWKLFGISKTMSDLKQDFCGCPEEQPINGGASSNKDKKNEGYFK